MSTLSKLLNQCRKPTGWLGRFVVHDFNRHHDKLTDWGLGHVTIDRHYTMLDIGCGGGLTVSKLAAIATEGKVYGVDFSEESVAISRQTNKHWSEMGRVEIQQASVSKLPFPDNMFDLATAIETHFFWPNLPADMREVQRVLKPGGTLVVIAEVYKGAKRYQKLGKAFAQVTNMAFLTLSEHGELFSNAGYSDVQVFDEHDKGWVCALGRKPS